MKNNRGKAKTACIEGGKNEMNEPRIRITQEDDPPGDAEVAEWIGRKNYRYWRQVTRWIDRSYPKVFTPEWLFGGKKHGWSLRYKKSKSFCTLIPEKNRFALLLVFGAKERAEVEAVLNDLSPPTQKEYRAATTYPDGKWLLLCIDSDPVMNDAMRLLAIKRKPNRPSGG